MLVRAVYRNFAKGGRIWGIDKRGGACRVEAQWYHVRCYTLGGGKNDTRGGECPPPPLNTALLASDPMAIIGSNWKMGGGEGLVHDPQCSQTNCIITNFFI